MWIRCFSTIPSSFYKAIFVSPSLPAGCSQSSSWFGRELEGRAACIWKENPIDLDPTHPLLALPCCLPSCRHSWLSAGLLQSTKLLPPRNPHVRRWKWTMAWTLAWSLQGFSCISPFIEKMLQGPPVLWCLESGRAEPPLRVFFRTGGKGSIAQRWPSFIPPRNSDYECVVWMCSCVLILIFWENSSYFFMPLWRGKKKSWVYLDLVSKSGEILMTFKVMAKPSLAFLGPR